MSATRAALALSLVFIAAQTASAQSQSPPGARPDLYVNFAGGGTKDARTEGAATAFGVSVRTGFLWFTVTPADLILTKGDTYPYYRDTFSNGESRCRNSLNGQFAEDSKCLAVDATYAATFDISAWIPRTPILFGGGYRFGAEPTPSIWFGTAGVGWMSATRRLNAAVKANIGSDYYSGLVTVGIRLGR
jgi:hypothetical protein